MNPEKEYEEIGLNYRFFLNWRNLLFGGFIVIIGTLLFNTKSLINCYPMIGSLSYQFVGFLALIFRGMDNRIRALYHVATNEGAKLETNKIGFYTVVSRPMKGIKHSDLLDIFYFSCAVILIIVSFFFTALAFLRLTQMIAVSLPNFPTEIINYLINRYPESCNL